METTCSYQCSACGQTYVGGSRAAAGACELCGRVGSLTCDGRPVPVSVPEDRTVFVISREAACRLAKRLLATGRSGPEIQRALVDEGLSSEVAAQIVKEVNKQASKTASNAALTSTIVGAVLFGAGFLLVLAEKHGTLQYKIAHTLALIGLVALIRGVYKVFTRP